MALWNKYPYTDFHELNLDWILSKMKEFDNTMTTFIALNTITWAGEWDATKSYVKWSIVQDSEGNGYISIQAVPAGIPIDNTDYWIKIAGYDTIYNDFSERIKVNSSNIAANRNNIDEALRRIDDNVTAINNVQTAADDAAHNATVANTAANNAISVANNAISVANNANTTANTVSGGLTTLSNLINCYIPSMQKINSITFAKPSSLSNYGLQGGCYNTRKNIYCAYFSNSDNTSGYIAEFNLITGALNASYGPFSYGHGSDMSYDGTNILLVTGSPATMLVLNATTYTLISTISLPSAAWGVAYDKSNNYIIATNYDSAWIYNKSYVLQQTITIGYTTPAESPTVQGCFIYNNGLFVIWTGLNGVTTLSEYNLSNLKGGIINNYRIGTDYYVSEAENCDIVGNRIYMFSRQGDYFLSFDCFDTSRQSDNTKIITGGKILDNGTDFNSLVTPGQYCISGTSQFNSMSNTPTYASAGGTLYVLCDSYYRLVQIYLPHEQWTSYSYHAPSFYIRSTDLSRSNYASVWTYWNCIGSTELNNKEFTMQGILSWTRTKLFFTGTTAQIMLLNHCQHITIEAYASGGRIAHSELRSNGEWATTNFTTTILSGNTFTVEWTSGTAFTYEDGSATANNIPIVAYFEDIS